MRRNFVPAFLDGGLFQLVPYLVGKLVGPDSLLGEDFPYAGGGGAVRDLNEGRLVVQGHRIELFFHLEGSQKGCQGQKNEKKQKNLLHDVKI